jgi:hypothetical protein
MNRRGSPQNKEFIRKVGTKAKRMKKSWPQRLRLNEQNIILLINHLFVSKILKDKEIVSIVPTKNIRFMNTKFGE